MSLAIAGESAGAVPPDGAGEALTDSQRLERVEQLLGELVAQIGTISAAANLITAAVQREGFAGLLKALPALMASGR